uniref:MerR family transcriptional regulator n=1 Tax=Rhodococcus sp. H36-A4 TaxID=3004353 RepID=UPI003FA72904
MTVWLDRFDAERYVGRSQRTLREWSRQGLVRTGRRRDGRVVYDRSSLRVAKRTAAARYRNRAVVAGPGRGRVASDPVEDWTLF